MAKKTELKVGTVAASKSQVTSTGGGSSGSGSGTNKLIMPSSTAQQPAAAQTPTTAPAATNTTSAGTAAGVSYTPITNPNYSSYTPGQASQTALTNLNNNTTYKESDSVQQARTAMQQHQTYVESPAVTAAKQTLQGVLDNQPGAFQSKYTQQINGLMNQISGRGDFSYDAESDPLYQMYKDLYTNNGRLAMKDSIAQGAALTGGYGNSWASSVGQQQYNQYMQQLNDKALDLRDRAYQQWQDQGTELYNQLNMYNNADNTDYGRYRDTVSDFFTNRDFAYNNYNNERNFDYGQFADNRNYYTDMYNNERNFDYGQQTDFRDFLNAQYQYQTNLDYDAQAADRSYYNGLALSILQSGKMPTDNMLELAGISKKDAKKLKAADPTAVAGGSSGSSGNNGNTGNGNDKKTPNLIEYASALAQNQKKKK